MPHLEGWGWGDGKTGQLLQGHSLQEVATDYRTWGASEEEEGVSGAPKA